MTARPNDAPARPAPSDRIRRFVVETDRPLGPAGRHRYASVAEARGVPVAEAVLAVPGIAEIFVEGNAVTALRTEHVPWEHLETRVRDAIVTALEGGAASPAASPPVGPLSDDDMYEVVERVFRRDINPAVAQHGGAVELLDVQDGVVVVRMMGGCQGCGMANVTLRQGIEATLGRTVPGFRGIRDITDHAAGENPYFRGPPPPGASSPATSPLPVID